MNFLKPTTYNLQPNRACPAKLQRSRGFMMVEVLVACVIITTAFLAATGVAQKSIQLSRQALHSAQASFLLEEGAEAVKILRDNNWSNISGLSVNTIYYPSFSGGTWTFSTTSSQVGIFTRTIIIANVNRNATTGDIAVSGNADAGTKLITVNVFWQEGGQTVSKSMSFYISDIFS